jgi:hypothetical protein
MRDDKLYVYVCMCDVSGVGVEGGEGREGGREWSVVMREWGRVAFFFFG